MVKQIGGTTYVRITANNVEIDANWNFFNDFLEAATYLEANVVKLDGYEYGFVKISKEWWKPD